MATFSVLSLVATEHVESTTEKGKMLPKKGEWVETSQVTADSRRQAMKKLRAEDKKEGRTNVQRKVELAA